MKRYYYCPDFDKYVKLDGFVYSLERDGTEIVNPYFEPILIGDIYAEDRSQAEYEKARQSLLDGQKSAQRTKR